MKWSITFFLLLALNVAAQTPRQYVAAGDKELMDGFPQSAIFYYEKALELDTLYLEAHYKIAESYRFQRNYQRAAKSYRETIDLDGQDQFLEAHFWYAMMLKQTGDYEAAKLRFDYFAEVYRKRDELYRWSRDEIDNCEWAIQHRNDSSKYEVTRPDSGLNTIHSELSPVLIDTQTIYFATMRYATDEVKKNDPVFIQVKKALKDSGIWELGEPEFEYESSAAHIANPTFSKDSSLMFFSKCSSLSSCEIYVSKWTGSDWGVAELAPEPVNELESSNTQPHFAEFDDKQYLIFASNRERGKGGMDLWYVEIEDGKPDRRVRNMGTRINTKGDEITPWFDNHDSTLYFASNRHPGFGGFDVFSSKGKITSFDPIENAGPVVNSPADDYYPTMRKQDSIGYFASNRITGLKKSGNETCCNDLYKIKVLEWDTTKEEVVDTLIVEEPDTIEVPQTIEQLQQYLPITLYFHNDRPNPRTLDTTTTISYTASLLDYRSRLGEYEDAIANSGLSEYEQQLAKQKTKAFFDQSVMDSEAELARATSVLLRELENGSSVTLAVKGYASALAKSDYNLNLTLRRISSMINYFRAYEDGVLIPYVDGTAENGARLVIQKIPYGESQANQELDEAGSGKYRAVYSIEAMKERKIEILKIERNAAE